MNNLRPAENRVSRLSFERVEKELRKRSFGILSTVSKSGRAQSSGVVYGVSPASAPFAIYLITERYTVKVRNIATNPNVSFLVPLFRGVLSFVPPASIQLHGSAKILETNDETALQTFRGSFLLRMMLDEDSSGVSAEQSDTCFVRIQPDSVVNTYGVGFFSLAIRATLGRGWSKGANSFGAVNVPAELYLLPRSVLPQAEQYDLLNGGFL
jgi:nitroimidazol reductase NimA-like FMN-containing flavoprotein (pyridoxamine 5'-phosphate oxidase superfamily)